MPRYPPARTIRKSEIAAANARVAITRPTMGSGVPSRIRMPCASQFTAMPASTVLKIMVTTAAAMSMRSRMVVRGRTVVIAVTTKYAARNPPATEESFASYIATVAPKSPMATMAYTNATPMRRCSDPPFCATSETYPVTAPTTPPTTCTLRSARTQTGPCTNVTRVAAIKPVTFVSPKWSGVGYGCGGCFGSGCTVPGGMSVESLVGGTMCFMRMYVTRFP